MSKDIWFRHYERRLAEAEERWPTILRHDPATLEQYAASAADHDVADELAEKADRFGDMLKERGL